MDPEGTVVSEIRKWIDPGGLMTMVNDTVLQIWKLLKVDLKCSQQRSANYATWQGSRLPVAIPLQRVPSNQHTDTSDFYTHAFPGGSVVTNPPTNAGDTDLIPGLERSPAEGDGNPLQYFCLGKPTGGGPGGLLSMRSQESDMTKWLNNVSIIPQ